MIPETVKKTANDRSLNSPNALAKGKGSPGWPLGGVVGRKQLQIPRNADRPAASISGCGLSCSRNLPTKKLAAIQPMVPRTRMPGKSRVASGTCVKVIELVSARVGLYTRAYARDTM